MGVPKLNRSRHIDPTLKKAQSESVNNGRSAPRKQLHPIEIGSISSLDTLEVLSWGGSLVQASENGLLFLVQREDLKLKELRQNLSLDALVGHRIMIYLPAFHLEISGSVTRTKYLGRDKGFAIALDYSEDAPDYWRECLVDMLPGLDDSL
jgi:hypothetical protein